MRPRRVVAPVERLPYTFRRADGTLILVREADLQTELEVAEAESRGITWHGETIAELLVYHG